MLDPSSFHPKSIRIVSQSPLSPGRIVSVRVLEDLGSGRFTLLLKGRVLIAESHLNLKPDEVIRALTERQDGIWKLRILPPQSSVQSDNLVSRHVQSDPRFLLFASLLRSGSGLPEEAEAFRLISLLSRTRGPRLRIARLYAELLNRGIDPSAAFLEHLESLFFGGHSGRQRQDSRPWKNVPDPVALSEDLSSDDTEDPLPALFSQVPDSRGCWTVRRFRRQLGSKFLNIVLKYRRFGKPALALTIHDSGRILEFLIEDLDPVLLNVYADENTEINEKLWKDFQYRLALKNVSVNPDIESLMNSDGFTVGAMETLAELEERL